LIARLEQAYSDVFEAAPWPEKRQSAALAWCQAVAKKRIEAIVKGQHRGSYDKAARLAVACAEVLQLRGETKKARTWLENIRDAYPRHRAFQEGLQSAMAATEFHKTISSVNVIHGFRR
jgi:hypothetical protein